MGMCIVRRLLRGCPNPCPLPATACRLENRVSKKQQQIEKAEINFKVRLADGRHMEGIWRSAVHDARLGARFGTLRDDAPLLPVQVKEDLKTVALGTSKINYLDPRITVAW